MRRRIVALSCLFFACGGENAARTELLIGALVPRTGPNQNVDWITAVELAHEHVTAGLNSARNPHQLSISLTTRDSASDPKLANQFVRELVGLGAKAVTGEASGSAEGGNRANYEANAVKVPFICFSCTNGNLNSTSYSNADADIQAAYRDEENWLFRTAPLVTNHSEIIVKNIASLRNNGDLNDDGKIKMVLITSSDPSGLSSIEPAKKLLLERIPDSSRLRIEVLMFKQDADPNGPEYASVLAAAHDGFLEVQKFEAGAVATVSKQQDDTPPDLIWNKSLPLPSVALVRAYRNGNYTTPMIHHDPVRRNTFLAALQDLADGQEGISVVAWEKNASGEVFKDAQRAKTGWLPTSFESNAYDAVAAAMLATIKAASALPNPADVTRAQVREALTAINDPQGEVIRTGPHEFARAVDLLAEGKPINYEGASGPVDFDAVGNVKAKVAYWKIKNRGYSEMMVYDCTTNDCTPVQTGP